jgi:hypothetical protein
MGIVRSFLFVFGVLASAGGLYAGEPVYKNDFQSAEVGKLPDNFMVMSGDFTVKEEGGNKFLELPGSPLDTFGLLFGPAQPTGGSASAKFFGTKVGRKYPAFGISLGGVGGYRVQVSAAKKALEIFKGDEGKASVPFTWESGVWTSVKIRIRKADAGWVVEGKAWPATAAEPAEWMIHEDEKDQPPAGRAAIWGSPYSGTPIRFDDLVLEAPAP